MSGLDDASVIFLLVSCILVGIFVTIGYFRVIVGYDEAQASSPPTEGSSLNGKVSEHCFWTPKKRMRDHNSS